MIVRFFGGGGKEKSVITIWVWCIFEFWFFEFSRAVDFKNQTPTKDLTAPENHDLWMLWGVGRRKIGLLSHGRCKFESWSCDFLGAVEKENQLATFWIRCTVEIKFVDYCWRNTFLCARAWRDPSILHSFDSKVNLETHSGFRIGFSAKFWFRDVSSQKICIFLWRNAFSCIRACRDAPVELQYLIFAIELGDKIWIQNTIQRKLVIQMRAVIKDLLIF